MQRIKHGVGTLFLMVLSWIAQAHPHSFITLQTELIAQSGQLTALKMRWTMDEITSADLLYDAADASPDDEIWRKLAAEVMANVLAQHYFTEFWHNGQRVKFSNKPAGYGLARKEYQVVLTFVLPLARPQPLAGQKYIFSTFDPTYYVDMRYQRDTHVQLPAALRQRCTARVDTPEPGEAIRQFALSLDKANAPAEEMELGKQFAQQVTLQCQ